MIGILVCGPSGVGKSSNLTKIFSMENITDILILDPDTRPEKEHSERSSETLKEVYNCIEDEKSFAYIATCGGIRIIKDILQKMKNKKYKTIVCIVYSSKDTAIERISTRNQKTPHEVIEDLHAFFSTKAERYMTMKNIDELFLFNNETNFKLILDKKKKKIKCYEKESSFYFDISNYCSSL